jgi:predicted helicase
MSFSPSVKNGYEQPAHTFTEMRTRENKKIRGDIFEEFCVLYLKHVRKYDSVWRLEDVPDEILVQLSLKRQDFWN